MGHAALGQKTKGRHQMTVAVFVVLFVFVVVFRNQNDPELT